MFTCKARREPARVKGSTTSGIKGSRRHVAIDMNILVNVLSGSDAHMAC